MEEILFKEEHRIFRQMVARFVEQEIEPYAEEWNEAALSPKEIWLKMGEMGLLGTAYEEKYGGSEGDLMYSIILAEELTRSSCSGISLSVCAHKDMASNYILNGSEELRMKYIPGCITGEIICSIAVTEPCGGSDVSAIQTSAVKDGDDYIINGQKTFISNATNAGVFVVAVKTDTKVSPGHRGISLLVVDRNTPGFTVGSRFKKMGTVASDVCELFFEDCRVPAGNLLGEENKGFKIIMERFGLERLIAGACFVTACEEMLKLTIKYCKEREAFGQSIFSFQANKHSIVEMVTKTTMSRTFLYDCCRRYMKGDDINKEISMVKYYTSELANKIAYECVGLHGGYGYMKEYPICQWYTDVRQYPIGAGTTQIMKEIIAKKIGI